MHKIPPRAGVGPGAGFDLKAAAARVDPDVMGALRDLLTRAQRAGAGRCRRRRRETLAAGCIAREHDAADSEARQRMCDIVCAGLRPKE